MEPILEIRGLRAGVGDKEILKGIDLTVLPGETHAIMGPNGSGKSTLAMVLAGHPGYAVTAGAVLYRGKDLLALAPEMRAREGLFLGFQYPLELPGVRTSQFLRASLNAVRAHRGQTELPFREFDRVLKEKMKLVSMPSALAARSVNEGFSGGEKKRNEVLQMALLEPHLAVLDETDSGLDIDALKTVAHGVNALRAPDRAILLVTHYQRLLNYILPDRVHVLIEGRVLRSGGPELALDLEAHGYEWIREQAQAAAPAPQPAVVPARASAAAGTPGRPPRQGGRGSRVSGDDARFEDDHCDGAAHPGQSGTRGGRDPREPLGHGGDRSGTETRRPTHDGVRGARGAGGPCGR